MQRARRQACRGKEAEGVACSLTLELLKSALVALVRVGIFVFMVLSAPHSGAAQTPGPKGVEPNEAACTTGWARRWQRRLGAPIGAVAAAWLSRRFRIAFSVLTAAVLGILGLFGGTAYAFFTASASGSATTTVGTLEPVAITTAMPTAPLLPGGTADLALTAHNPNGFSVTITSLAAGAGTVVVRGGTGCTAANAAVTVVPTANLSFPLGPGATTTIDIAHGAQMGTHSFSGCQGATFDLPVTLKVKR